jgi:hypothetical protein
MNDSTKRQIKWPGYTLHLTDTCDVAADLITPVKI